MWFVKIKRLFAKRRIERGGEIDPDEILLDGANLPSFDVYQFEGRLVKAISKGSVISVGIFLALIVILFSVKIWQLQVAQGAEYRAKGEANRLRHTLVFAERGVISDRNKNLLAWNVKSDLEKEFSLREYAPIDGFGNLLGFVKYPSKDTAGFYYREDFAGLDGLEKNYDSTLSGKNGIKITETDALDRVQSESVLRPPADGKSLVLTVDSRLQSALFKFIKETAISAGFTGGAGVIMDTKTGELISLTTYPEYESQTLTDGSDKRRIQNFIDDKRKPFLFRAISGLYTPGSIVKPFVALGALQENIIDPSKQILSTGSISIPNQYDPTKKSVFTDWKAHGLVDMRQALAVSSNVYFYEIGGGFEKQPGLGISRINKYVRLFGFGSDVPGEMFAGAAGVVPTPEWKAENFEDKTWRIGDTYNTAIGQYGFQVTPLQMVRAIGAIANDGKLFEPQIIKSETPAKFQKLPITESYYQIVREGMRRAVLEGTTQALNIPQVEIAGKTGTAELGTTKSYVNSWVTGFFPYRDPHYVFAVIMEKGPRANLIGAAYVTRQFMEWLYQNAPEYLS